MRFWLRLKVSASELHFRNALESGFSEVKVSSWSGCRATGGLSCTQAACSLRRLLDKEKFCESTRVVWLRFSLRSITTLNMLAKSSLPCSAARDCFSPHCAALGESGYSL